MFCNFRVFYFTVYYIQQLPVIGHAIYLMIYPLKYSSLMVTQTEPKYVGGNEYVFVFVCVYVYVCIYIYV